MRTEAINPGGIWVAVLALLFFFGLRLHNIDAFPLFIDETIAIGWTMDIANDRLLQHTGDGKLTLPYYMLLFQPQENAPWVSRASLLILTSLGLAAEFAIARRIAGLKAALITLALIGFSPMLIFFDRLVLADTLLRVTISLWVLFLLHLFDHSRPRHILAVGCGLVFVMALSVKAPSLFLLPLPVVALLAHPRWKLVDRLKALALIYAVVAVLWLPVLLVLASRKINYFDKSDSFLSVGEQLFSVSRIAGNLSQLLDMLFTYHSAILVVALALATLLAFSLHPRRLLTPLACFVGFELAVVWLGFRISYLRYFMPVAPIFFVSAGIALTLLHGTLNARLRRFASAMLLALLVAWIVTVALPFIRLLYVGHSALRLPAADRNEYIVFNSAGYAIPELARNLAADAADAETYVVGAFVGCETLRLYLPAASNVILDCPNILAGGRRAKYLNSYLPQLGAEREQFLLVMETGGLVASAELVGVNLRLLEVIPRPGNVSDIQLYSVTS